MTPVRLRAYAVLWLWLPVNSRCYLLLRKERNAVRIRSECVCVCVRALRTFAIRNCSREGNGSLCRSKNWERKNFSHKVKHVCGGGDGDTKSNVLKRLTIGHLCLMRYMVFRIFIFCAMVFVSGTMSVDNNKGSWKERCVMRTKEK